MIRLLVVLVLALAAAAPPAAAQRLPDTFVPEHYTLWFGPDLVKETFDGRASISGRLTRSTSTITLHAAELQFREVRISRDGRSDTVIVTPDAAAETVTLALPRAFTPGAITLDFVYTGILNDKLRGFYISKANGRSYAVTQMEATDARRAFPAVDEPSYKATFDISVTAAARDTVLSNGRQVSDVPGPAPGSHTVTFARTPKMSTYLVAMLVGDFVCREGRAGETVVRGCATPDKIDLTGFALETARQQLLYFNDYFGIPYAFGKLDIIAVPDFSAGAMENAGAITFRERLLLIDPSQSSIDAQKRVASVIAHEIAHQWFGNLVTMRWWDDIWLNEGFASWVEYKPMAAQHPEWRIGLAEAEETQGSLGVDALSASTRPIRLRVSTPDEIGQVFDGIAYGKTASVLRMIEAYVGPDRFRDAVRAYLRKFAFGNAAGEDFWTEVSRVTGRPVDRILRGFVDQAGAPALAVRTSCQGGETAITVSQARFSGAPGSEVPPTTWTLPVCTSVAGQPPRCELLDSATASFRVPGCDPRVANAGGVGYYFTDYPAETVRALAAQADRLSPAERLRLIGDEWWMVRAERHDIGVYLDLTDALAGDDTPEVLDAIAARLAFAKAYLVLPAQRPAFEAWVRRRFRPALDALGWPGRADEPGDRQNRRATLLTLVGTTGNDPDVQARAREWVRRAATDASLVPPTLASPLLRVAAASGDVALYDHYLAQAERLKGRPEEYYRYLNALPAFGDPALIRRTLDLALSPQIRSQDVAGLLAGALASGAGRDAAWAFIQSEWTALTRKVDVFQGLPGIVSALGSLCSLDASRAVSAFFGSRDLKGIDRSVKQAIERIDSCTALSAKQAAPLGAWLSTRAN